MGLLVSCHNEGALWVTLTCKGLPTGALPQLHPRLGQSLCAGDGYEHSVPVQPCHSTRRPTGHKCVCGGGGGANHTHTHTHLEAFSQALPVLREAVSRYYRDEPPSTPEYLRLRALPASSFANYVPFAAFHE